MIGDSSDEIWGVMDVIPRTNFPDIRKKTILHSEKGSLAIIPREGDIMVRLYIELAGEEAKISSLEDLQKRAQTIFHPYNIEFMDTEWWSKYSVGQRVAEAFSIQDRVFLLGDAAHTHSPKAGQGMNISLQDGNNMGWKLSSVLKGRMSRDLMKTYVLERGKVANDLIEFDRYWSKLFSTAYREEHGITQDMYKESMIQSRKYTAGLGVCYAKSPITRPRETFNGKLTVGERFPNAQVVRFFDARPIPLLGALKSDLTWRILVFSGDINDVKYREKLDKVRN